MEDFVFMHIRVAQDFHALSKKLSHYFRRFLKNILNGRMRLSLAMESGGDVKF